MAKPAEMVTFKNGTSMANRFALAPLTNTQSHENGELSDEELHWLSMRAQGGFGMTITCASHVQEIGKGFPGQLGIFSDQLIDGHKRLTQAIQKHGSLAVIQLHHAGMRTPNELINNQLAVCPSENEKYHARALSLVEIEQLKNDFVKAAKRAYTCGYDGVEIHGAHGYIIAQFLSTTINQRKDKYGGSLENRARLLFEIVEDIREKCGKDFLLGVRLSPEKFGMDIQETKWIIEKLIQDNQIDFLDISLWNCFKMPEDGKYQDKTLLAHFSSINYQNIKWTVAGKIYTAQDVQKILDAGVDFVSIGKAAILHHDFPQKVIKNHHFEPIATPVSSSYLQQEGLSKKFIDYLKKWPELVQA